MSPVLVGRFFTAEPSGKPRKSFFVVSLFAFLAVLGLHCCTQAVSSCGVRRLTVAVSVAVQHRLLGAWASVVAPCGFSSCGTQA